MIFSRSIAILCILCSCLFGSCYSFKGISIPPGIGTFYVDPFQNGTQNGPPDIGQQYAELLREIILRNSRLTYNDVDPDIEFSGSVTGFSVTSVAPQETDAGFGSALNRLQISLQVSYVSNQNEDDNWNQSFSFFQDFESTQDLVSVQDELIDVIFEQLTQDVFNRAFTNW